ncbi:DAK2 domain fusion protein YloV [Sedimentibacter acidaminivorans]|jgi:fatty acid kinase|uniref:DAK2 domain fusion protein YloV n=1 Tax=Sedimentibacter acidaminivorans TaxID=913099 RepID=A0ABS4GB08_9FIRM|nr:DAK2 domain-containing protein [Sedimentibacter acidaminivorans]MBP1924862.1 DAK2 domain fusion protein YloV [Sedimentibacter acidaminivorans]
MIIKYIDNITFKKMLLGAAVNLENNKNIVDSLNVFPVPDGDTGTNMNLTVQAAIKEINILKESSIGKIAEAVANGSLMGARGNSGVILSQLFRGLYKGLGNASRIDTQIIAEAFKSATDTAYKAVMKPVEGTILTVARETSERAMTTYTEYEDVVLFLEDLIKQAKDTLSRTPEMLKVLKQADVVDAGGKGLVYLLEGALASLKGVEIKQEKTDRVEIVETEQELKSFTSEDEILFAYCTEFIIKNPKKSHEEFLSIIHDKGDSIVCVGDENIIKVHIHTNNPGQILNMAVKYGELIKIKIDNMKEQFREKYKNAPAKIEEKKEYGFVSIGMGEGIEKVFSDLNVDVFISGGQTMNPSTEDILAASNKVNAENIIILPNNSNIILAATQAKEMSDKNIHVIPSKSIPQGIAAMLAFKEDNNVLENVNSMSAAVTEVKTGQITYAVRDTIFNDMEIKKDEIIALYDGEIVTHGKNAEDQAVELVKSMVDTDSFLITLFYGENIDKNTVKNLKSRIEEEAEECDVEIIYGGQPLYYYIISVE